MGSLLGQSRFKLHVYKVQLGKAQKYKMYLRHCMKGAYKVCQVQVQVCMVQMQGCRNKGAICLPTWACVSLGGSTTPLLPPDLVLLPKLTAAPPLGEGDSSGDFLTASARDLPAPCSAREESLCGNGLCK